MKSSSGYEIYHNTLSACLDEIERYVQSKGYQVGEYFPLVNHVAYGQTERTSLEMVKNGNVANTLSIQIYRMDSGRYELNCYPVRKFDKGGSLSKGDIYEGREVFSEIGSYNSEADARAVVERNNKFFTENDQPLVADVVSYSKKMGDRDVKIIKAVVFHKKEFKTGGYTRPAYNLKTTGNYLFRTNKGTFDVTSYLFERENDIEDALEIQDDLRGTIGSVIIKNSAWKNLSSGKSVKARSSKGDYFGTLIRVGDNTRSALKLSGGGSTDEGIDLFEDYENIPPQVMAILNEYAEGIEDGDYNAMGDAQNELEEIGYTFDYYVDGSVFDLRPIGTKGKTQDYATGGGVKTLKVGDKYLYKFDNKVYEVLGVGIKQVALAPLPISSYWNNWIVSKTLMERWVKNRTMIKQK